MIRTADNKKYLHGSREPQEASLRLIQSRRLHLDSGDAYRIPVTESDTLFWLADGSLRFQGQRVEQGCVLFVAKFSCLHLTAENAAVLLEIRFSYSEEIPLLGEKSRLLRAPLELQGWFQKIDQGRLFQHRLPGADEGLLLNILDSLNLLCTSRSTELDLYQRCCQWLDRHIAEDINAESVAAAMGCTTAHLNRIVQKHSGKCLSVILADRKISAIRQMVQTGNASTAAIAARLHFQSPELLRKFFKYHTGRTLKEYRAECLR